MNISENTICDWEMPCNCGEDFVKCGEVSRFQVERSDRNPAYDAFQENSATESCEAHLAPTVWALIEGDETITATVTPRFGG